MNDSIWATVLGVVKTLGVPLEYALYGISYRNALLFSRAMPMPGDEDDDERPLFDESLDANNPDNFDKFNDFDDEEVIRGYGFNR